MIEIVGRQSSHYTRMVRMLARELEVEYTLCPIHDLLSSDPLVFAGNPALKLPAVRIGDDVVWGSQNACRAIARLAPGGESRVIWAEQMKTPLTMNAHEVLAHAMAVQVEVVFHEVVAKRAADAASTKRRASLLHCLDWLDRQLPDIRRALPADRIALFDLGLYCLLEHLPFRNPIDLGEHRRLTAFSTEIGKRESARATPYRFDAPAAPAATA